MPLSTTPDIQLWSTLASGGHGIASTDGDSTTGAIGTALLKLYENSIDDPLTAGIAEGLYRPSDIVFDTVHGKFFIADSDTAGNNRILQGEISDLLTNPGGAPNLTVLYSDTGSGANARIDHLEIDPDNGMVYFTHGDNFEKVSYDTPLQASVVLFNANVSSGSSPSGVANPAGSTNNFFNDVAINFATGDVYLSSTRVGVSATGDVVSKNFVYRLSGLTAASDTNAFTFGAANSGSASLLTFGPSDDQYNPNPGTVASPANAANETYFFPVEYGSLDGLAIDGATNTLYFSTGAILFDHDTDTGTAPISQPGGIFSYALTGNPTGSYTQVFQQTVGSGPQGLLGDLEIDPVTGRWYAVDYTGGTAGAGDEGIWTGNLDGTGTATLFQLINNAGGQFPSGFTINHAPTVVLTDSGAAATEDAGPGSGFGAAVQPLAGISVDDFETADDADQIAGATVRISDGYGSVAGHAERLTIGGSISGTLGSGIGYSFDSPTGVMTLTGLATFAEYEAALAAVSYSISGDNPDGYGAFPTREIAYSVSDGLVTSDEQAVIVDIAAVNDEPTAPATGSAIASEDGASAPTSIGAGDVDSDTLTYSEKAGSEASSGTVTFDQANGTFTYTPDADFNGSDSFIILIDDGNGGTAEQVVTVAVGPVNDAPTLAGDGTEQAADIVEDTPSATGETVGDLFGGQYSDAADEVPGGSAADAFAGVAIVGNGSSPAVGQWQYHNGVNWVTIGTTSSGVAVLLDASTAIRFNPAPGFVGAAPTLAVHLVDASAGTLVSGSVADLTTTGGNTPYSSGTVELSQEVLDGNSPPTAVSGMLTVDEFPSNGTVVGTVTGHDPDSAVLTYALVDDADGRFDINGTTGVVTVQDGLLIDYEQQAGHSIRVAVTDDQGESAEFDMAVAVQDVHGEIESGDARGNIMIGGAETDIFIGNTGSDMLSGGDGSDVLIGGTGILDFGNDGDALNGDGGIDVLYGGGGNDALNGGAQADVLIGGNGDDVLVFQKGQANGDTVLDFFGAGSAAGDSVVLQGYDAGTSFTRVGGFGSDLYQINDHGFIEYVTIMGLGQVHASDVTFI